MAARPGGVLRWNEDKKHRCPYCHAVAMSFRPSSWAIYQCCRCDVRFARWPWLAPVLPFRGVVCDEHKEVS